MVDKTLSNLRSGLTNPDTFSQQENDEAKKELATDVNEILDEGQTDKSILPEESSLTPVYSTPILLPFSELNLSVRLHNLKPTYLQLFIVQDPHGRVGRLHVVSTLLPR